jgi:hypothetical protein
MRLGLLTIASTALACLACESVDVHYVPPAETGDAAVVDAATDGRSPAIDSGAPDSAEAGSLSDSGRVIVEAGPLHVLDASASSAAGFCGCDHTAGAGCCVQHEGPAFCSDTYDACLAAGGMFVLCETSSPTTESVCCWNGSGSSSSTALAASCGARSTACTSDADCGGGRCARTMCGGILVGACGAPPACP